MKILLINKFLYPKGGDAICTLNTGQLLRSKGHEVIFWGMDHPKNAIYPYKESFISHADFDNPGGIKQQIKLSLNLLYSWEAKSKLEYVLTTEQPDIVHLNNFAHQISPSILHCIKKFNIPTVATLHDYKLVCASYLLLSNGNICEKCKGGKYYHCLLENCVKASRAKSLLNTIEMYFHHKTLHIYHLLDVVISPSIFLKDKVKEMGFEKEIVYMPNFIDLNDFEPCFTWNEKSVVYFGRLSKEKGLFTLIDAFDQINRTDLKLIGDGPLRGALESYVKNKQINNVHFLGFQSGDNLKNEIRESMAVVLSSECYENNPGSVVEAFALGKPVVASRIGGIPELVKDGMTGYTYTTKDAGDLCKKINILLDNHSKIVEMGKTARKFVEDKFNSEKYYQRLLRVYKQARTMMVS